MIDHYLVPFVEGIIIAMWVILTARAINHVLYHNAMRRAEAAIAAEQQAHTQELLRLRTQAIVETMAQSTEQVACRLLRETIGAEEWQHLATAGHLKVQSKLYYATYMLCIGTPVTVTTIQEETTINQICIVPKDRHPLYDTLLCQWLLCKYDEPRLWNVGAHNPNYPRRRPPMRPC